MEEYELRREQFAKIDSAIEEHNSSESSFVMGHNHLSTYTDSEYNRLMGYKPMATSAYDFVDEFDDSAPLAAAVDWREKNAVTPVKDQGDCGSCWTFSSTGALEGQYAIKNGTLKSFSEQQLVECVNMCGGCDGGDYTIVFGIYGMNNKFETESSYPYTSGKAGLVGTCKYDKTKGIFETKGTGTVKAKSSDALRSALNSGPVSVGIQADCTPFRNYKSGIFNSSCGTNLNHAVLLVGYGANYYILKNSWNSNWGESGYMRMAIEDGNGICGVQK